MKEHIGYKVVTSGLSSFSISGHQAQVQYQVGSLCKPRPGRGPLAVFSRKSAAIRFNFESGGGPGLSLIFRCHYAPSDASELFNGFTRCHISTCPKSTVFADSVTLLEKV